MASPLTMNACIARSTAVVGADGRVVVCGEAVQSSQLRELPFRTLEDPVDGKGPQWGPELAARPNVVHVLASSDVLVAIDDQGRIWQTRQGLQARDRPPSQCWWPFESLQRIRPVVCAIGSMEVIAQGDDGRVYRCSYWSQKRDVRLKVELHVEWSGLERRFVDMSVGHHVNIALDTEGDVWVQWRTRGKPSPFAVATFAEGHELDDDDRVVRVYAGFDVRPLGQRDDGCR